MTRPNIPYLSAAFAAIAFVAFAAVLTRELFSFRNATAEWARRDLRSQATLAAENLAEPLRTQDFRRLHALANELREKELFLSVYSDRGGTVFSSAPREPTMAERIVDGEYVVEIAIRSARVYEPFDRALVGIALAALVGIAGVMLFFVVIYRQRVRIAELKRLEAFRRDFIADVSHELKTPLTGIIGAVDMLDDAEGEVKSRLCGMVRREAERLNSLAQDVLSLARLEREEGTLRLQDTDLADLVAEAAERHAVRSSVAAHWRTRCDAQLIAQAIDNLIVNAKRHSGTDDITVSLDEKGMIVVEDHGVGIPPEHARRVFERFYRVDSARSAETGGAGLGLAIVRRIARLHGGDVTLESAKPTGCRFIIDTGNARSRAAKPISCV